MAVTLERAATDGQWSMLAHTVTDADGRCRDLGEPAGEPAGQPTVGGGADTTAPVSPTPSAPPGPGRYRLTFDTRAWFAADGRSAFYPEVTVVFEVTDTRHHHVPLLLAPFGYSTYRGS